MTIEFFWHLPTSGDSRYGDATVQRRGERELGARPPFTQGVTDPRGNTFNYFDYLHQIARAAELVGFDGLRIPNEVNGEEPWIVAGYLGPSTRKLTLLAEFEASRGSAVYAAKNAVSHQRYTNGRFSWQISTGSNAKQRRQGGDFIAEEDIHARIEEFITVAQGVITQSPFTYKGRFFEVLDGGFKGSLANQKVPPVHLSGRSEQALQLSAKLADVHVFDAAPIADLQSSIDYLQQLATVQNRKVAIGLRVDLIARDNEEEARFDAQRYAEQTGQQPHIITEAGLQWWYGLTTQQNGAAATLVGTYQQIIDVLKHYADAGVSHFQLSAIPHFDEAYRIGEQLLPALRALTSAPQQHAA